MVHDFGIGTASNPGALPTLQQEINNAMENALPANEDDWGKSGVGLWGYGSKDWLEELSKEGSLEQEYLVSVTDSYYGLWESYSETDGGMWGIYIAKTREDIKEKDPIGYKLVESFLPPYFTYMDRLDDSFSGTFNMTLDINETYTYKSQYITNLRLTGSNNTNIIGNDLDNILLGNSGNNILDGGYGIDIVQFIGASYEYILDGNVITDTLNRDGQDTLINIEVLRFTDKDIEIG